jgi:serine/threonine protein kinase
MIVAACPDLDRLLRFLEGPSPGVDDEAIAGHVEGCASCRAELERLAAATEVPALRAARTDREPTSDLAFLQDLKGLDLRHLGDPPTPRSPVGSSPPEVPGYEILGELGRGGAGVVYHARHRTLDRPVAIKMLHPSLFPTEADRHRLRAEAEAVARLQHPNVVQLYEVGEADGSPYLVLEYVSGGTLESYLAGRPQPPREVADLVETLARAVHAAHLEHIVHRDLKPANILLRREDPTASDRRADNGPRPAGPSSCGIPKVSDFGLAKRLDRSASGLTQTLSGTPAYMSPEQVPERAGEPPRTPVTPATDVYALGVILYEMLTGRPPFLGTDWVTTLLQVVRRAPLPPRDLQPGTPRDLETICLKCLEKEPWKRYATAGELADDLGRFLDHRPIRARPVRPLGRLVRWGRRNPVPAGLLSALVVTGLVALAAVLWQWRKAERARQVADALAGSEAEQRLKAERAAMFAR